ncbi:alkaline phosphatase D family protein [Tamlana sp. 2_MG-2023]|uniref:alkaline phosphatase D family protein n=1 Tax=unclassified Tamlana TaxID=2614803 RepID=UPI0026E41F5A|nr:MULTISPECIES: alkaline phosphatase D family protein [unclassified Tamlana]MDO6761258.1 alkaline phosphatase D family protein [Tamlana sp. 2_MG-2023]MDO6791741.1 alkaline phosphatase D family protein [Tamlana sp. 1_MG-2023]
MNQIIKTFLLLLLVQNGYSQPKHKKVKNGVCFALYTVHANTLKLTAQFYPVKAYDPFEATLQIRENNIWETVQESRIAYPGYTAHFRIEDWNDSTKKQYRIVYKKNQFYEGIIRKNPKEKGEIVMAAFSCWSTYQQHGGSGAKDITDNLKKLNPDVLFFAGDQVYDHSDHYGNWLKFGETFGDIIKNTPTITIPDDHDVGQGNFWGDGGRKSKDRDGASGGYYMPVSYIEEVERAQTSHLPDPYDPTPIEQGIGVYYTNYTWGGISFAIIEDRKFKSGPKRVLEDNQYRFDNTRDMDVEGATLLGKRQLDFLEDWTTDWKDAEIKAVLSQTIFTNLATHTPTIDKKTKFSTDSNGWPQAGRNKALEVIRKSYSCMIAGDQHLGSVVHHGVEDWNNAGYSFAVPAAANFWMRWWNPDSPGKNKKAHAPNYTGEYTDAFHNKITVHAVANPTHKDNTAKSNLLDGRAAGFGVIKFNKSKREITYECWKRNVDITDPRSKQYDGWPITFSQTDNFQLKSAFELPELQISKPNQVVTVRNNYTKNVVSSLRIKGDSYQPKVMYAGEYTVEIGEGTSKKRYFDIVATKKNTGVLNVEL